MKLRLLFGTSLVLFVAGLVALDAFYEVRVGLSVLVCALACAGWREFASMTGVASKDHGGGRVLAAVGALGVVYFCGINWGFASRLAAGDSSQIGDYSTALLVGIVGLLLASFAAVLPQADPVLALRAVFSTTGGVLLLGAFFSFSLVPYHREDGLRTAAVFFFGIKGNDIAAYFVGRAVGRTRFLKVRPKKTLEGCLGALIFCVSWFVTVDWLWPGAFFPWPGAIGAGIILSITTQLGDLSESLIKRAYQVKDSGRLLPEFGGVLDMIDSMLFSAVAFWFLLRCMS